MAEEELNEEKSVSEEQEVAEPKVEESKASKPKESKPSREDLAREIEAVLEELYESESEPEPPKAAAKNPSKDDFEKALAKVTEKVESRLREDYEGKLDAKFKELNERLESLSANRTAPRDSQKNPFGKGSKEGNEYSAKESFLRDYGLLKS